MNDEPGLEPLLCFDLYAAQRAVTAAYRPILGELGVTYPQYLVLVLLWERDALQIKEISTRLRLDHATLTPLLRRLESTGLVARERSLVDERSVTVRLTPRGDALRGREEDVRCRIGDAMGLDADDVVVLRDLLRRLTGHLDHARPGGSDAAGVAPTA